MWKVCTPSGIVCVCSSQPYQTARPDPPHGDRRSLYCIKKAQAPEYQTQPQGNRKIAVWYWLYRICPSQRTIRVGVGLDRKGYKLFQCAPPCKTNNFPKLDWGQCLCACESDDGEPYMYVMRAHEQPS